MQICKNLKKKLNGALYCKLLKKEIYISNCNGCMDKKYKTNKPSKRTQALAIPKNMKLIVWERDNHRCIFCQKLVHWSMANSHVIKRSHSGLGTEKNIITNCRKCHELLDDSIERLERLEYAKQYLLGIYGEIEENDTIYKK